MNISKFQTVVDIPAYTWKTGYSKKNIFMGSCFTENVGNRMAVLKYNVDINPFGILYNPLSVAKGLRILLHQKEFRTADLIQADGLWHSFYHHGRFSSSNEEETLETINKRIKTSSEFLKIADILFVTFGTAWIYKFKKTGLAVSNCHKIPSIEFERVRLSVEEFVAEYRQLFSEIRQINPSIKVIFTVSPIRHWKDGAVENQRSKAILLLAIDKLTKEFGDEFCAYFPAYEIVMDELRDYRFYTGDMIHISDFAIDHIWEKFSDSLIDKESIQISTRINKIVQAINHKPLHPNSSDYSKFLYQMVNQVNQIAGDFPKIDLKFEKDFFIAEIEKSGNKIG